MAAITRTNPRHVTPPGYEYVTSTQLATEAIPRGTLAVRGAAGWSKAPVSSLRADGIALKDYAAGQDDCEFGKIGEMDGFTFPAVNPGVPVYSSATTAGELDTTSVASAIVQVRYVGGNRIEYNFFA
jgi:hypothetical protein